MQPKQKTPSIFAGQFQAARENLENSGYIAPTAKKPESRLQSSRGGSPKEPGQSPKVRDESTQHHSVKERTLPCDCPNERFLPPLITSSRREKNADFVVAIEQFKTTPPFLTNGETLPYTSRPAHRERTTQGQRGNHTVDEKKWREAHGHG